MVADSHLMDIPLESVYSSVVSLRGLRIVIFLSELNGLDHWLQISVMLIWKLLPWNEIISLQVLNLVSWKDII
jgi:hypothetical protein